MSSTNVPPSNSHFPWPVDLEMERLVLGAILIQDPGVAGVWDVLAVDDFSLRKHQKIYRRMLALHRRHEPVDRITVATELRVHAELESVDGLGYIVTLDDGLPTASHADRYIEMLHQLALRRRAIQASAGLIKNLGNLAMDPESLLSEHRGRLESIGEQRAVQTLKRGDIWAYDSTISYVVQDLVIDGGITMFTGEPGAGKSMLLLALAKAVADGVPFAGFETQKRPVVSLDREMPVGLVRQRLLDLRIDSMYPQLRILGGWEGSEAPGPTSRELLALARDEHALFIFDPLLAFSRSDENDNSAIRAHLQLYRPLCEAGGQLSSAITNLISPTRRTVAAAIISAASIRDGLWGETANPSPII